ncbi:MAG TPA: response regulator [Polyangiaceae bacterium]|nr:response regulator [Polyangiaceae bacterium]
MSQQDEELPTLLLVDDDDAFRSAMGLALERRGFSVIAAASPTEALRLAAKAELEYALVDVRMPGGSGIDLVEQLRAIDDGTRVVVMTGYGTIANAVAAMKAGAFDYLTKPVDADAVENALLGVRRDDRGEGAVPSLERVEWEYLQRVLSDCDGNVSLAARKLGMHRRSLQRKLGRNAPRK